MLKSHRDRHEGEVNGRRPLTRTLVSWCRSIGLEDVEGRAAGPWAAPSCFGNSSETNKSGIDGFESGCLCLGCVRVGTKSSNIGESDTILTGRDLVLSNVAIERAVLSRNVCNAVDQI